MKLVMYLMIPVLIVVSALLSYNLLFPVKIESQPEPKKISKLLGESKISVISDQDMSVTASAPRISIAKEELPVIPKIVPDILKASEKPVAPFLFA
jgi:hypothetical protein